MSASVNEQPMMRSSSFIVAPRVRRKALIVKMRPSHATWYGACDSWHAILFW